MPKPKRKAVADRPVAQPLSLDACDDDFMITRSQLPLYGLAMWSKPHLMRMCQEGKFPKPVYISTNRMAWRAGDLKRWRASRQPRAAYEAKEATA